MLCDVTPINPQTGHPDNSLPGSPAYPSHGLPGGGHIMPPIVLPPLPGIWPPPGKPNLPDNSLPGGGINYPSGGPIYIPIGPDNELPVPPGTIWPPLPPDLGIAGKYVILILVLGVGYRWFVTEGNVTWPPTTPPATPK